MKAKREHNPALYEAILALETPAECIDFFEDLCTVGELSAMEQRYQVAKGLHQGKIYNEILAETGASSATISRVNRTLQYGNGGYDLVFSRLESPNPTDDRSATGK
ncbi:MAG: TrpR-like protein [Oscillospiraceae bacterium]|nr:TrpR-like protein [Oscillospiraceae bacterium]MBQ6428814.1 TrpR-like protein [Oscillospiraceae bacterium]